MDNNERGRNQVTGLSFNRTEYFCKKTRITLEDTNIEVDNYFIKDKQKTL